MQEKLKKDFSHIIVFLNNAHLSMLCLITSFASAQCFFQAQKSQNCNQNQKQEYKTAGLDPKYIY